MFARSFLVALLVFGFAVPAAHAADTLGDAYVPDYSAADGVYIRTGADDIPYMVFGKKAAKLYKGLAGRRATVTCGTVTASGSGGLVSTGRGESTITLPRRRGGRIFLFDNSEGAEICAIATKRVKADNVCIPLEISETKSCTRVAVALTDSGRAHLDRKKRTYELVSVSFALSLIGDGKTPAQAEVDKFFGGYVVALDGPDASPPAGKVGYWISEATDESAFVSLLADGSRAFMSYRGGVYSTNLTGLMGPSEDAAGLF